MPEIAIKNISNKDAGTMKLSEEHFGISGKDALMHSSVVNHLANQRQGTHSTKTRSGVRGGGAKPFRQKGTGRARAGTNTSPLWRGGGVVFGPHPRDYSYKMPKKARRQAFYAALSAKIVDAEVVVIDELKLENHKTKQMVQILDNLELSSGSVLVVTKDLENNVLLASRNIPAVRVKMASSINAYDVLANNMILITSDALKSLEMEEEE
jgi:large subunit ribosomal protein L4